MKLHRNKTDTKQLYKLIAKLTSLQKDINPMPNVCSEYNLAEHFADFSVDEIMKIQNELH